MEFSQNCHRLHPTAKRKLYCYNESSIVTTKALLLKRKPSNRFVMHPKRKVGAFCPSGLQADFAAAMAAKEEGENNS